ncbi:MerR family transcriptional regulator [Desulfovermiculus halophilus]|uniref:MerR family transcriptional regulator n=1 Tax=Desulfovermiculus halophilus TaxID=339722 RepID=UPI0012946546
MASRGERTYKIGYAAQLLGLEPYVLRFWETEFPQLRPIRTPKGQRLYTDDHLRLIGRIKTLLYEHGLTIDGARRKLDQDSHWLDMLADIHTELLDIRHSLLSGPLQPDSVTSSRAAMPSKTPPSGQEQGNQDRHQEGEDDAVDHGEQGEPGPNQPVNNRQSGIH